jgi:lipid-binding SYLF domain-containing protein
MQHLTIQHGSDASAEEIAAALAAVSLILAEEAQGVAVAPEAVQPGWITAARLTTQGLAPSRMPTAIRWNSIERIRRAGRGGSGIV